jgi:two-component system, OmpR family, sensor histidine kinase CiaH
MFEKLRLKLTLINVAVILTLFLLLIVGAYYFSQIDMQRRADSLARKIVADVQSGLIIDMPQRNNSPPGLPPGFLPGPQPWPPSGSLLRPPHTPPLGPNFFFVITSTSGIITYQSFSQSLKPDRLAVLTEETLKADHPQGTITFEHIKYSYLKSPLNNQPGTLVLFHDLSQETNMQRVLLTALIVVGSICSFLSFGASSFMANRAMVPIQKAWQQQKDFLSDASHELRTPLTIIQTNLDIVRRKPNETVSSQSKWLNNIQEESIYMAQLVDSLLFLARADSEQKLLDKRPFLFTEALMRAVAPFEAVAAAQGLSLEIVASAPAKGYGDEMRIKQVIAILLDNAIRHTPTGGKVLVSLSQSDTITVLTVADSGEGIEPEYLDKIFERFYQVDQSRSKGGAGLGLAIAQRIVESHGGVITVASTPRTGTTFKVCFPLGKASI